MNKANYYLGVFLIIFSFSAWADKGNFFFENVSNNPFDINEIKRNIYSDLDLDLDTKQINYSVKKIEYLFLDLIINNDYAGRHLAYQKHQEKIFTISGLIGSKASDELEKLALYEERELLAIEKKQPHVRITEDIKKQKQLMTALWSREKKWSDFSTYLVNQSASFWDGGLNKNAWLPHVNPDYKEFKQRGVSETIWGVMNKTSNAKIYYTERHFLKADLAAHNAILAFFSLHYSANKVNKSLNMLLKDLAFYELLDYFYTFAADKRMCEFLVDTYFNSRNTNEIPINKNIAVKLSYLISGISGNFYNESNISPKQQMLEMKKILTNSNNKAKVSSVIGRFALTLFLKGEEDEAKKFWNENKISTIEYSILEDIVDGYVNNESNIPTTESKTMMNIINESVDPSNYNYLYSKMFENFINALASRNSGQLLARDRFLREASNFLFEIANVYIHPPGTTLPSIFTENKLLLEIMLNLSEESNLSKDEKNKIIQTASNLSLNSDEFQYVQDQELIENTKSDYAKDISLKISKQIYKRERRYKKIFYDSLSGLEVSKEEHKKLILDLEMHNQRIHNAQLYLDNKKYIQRNEKVIKIVPNEDELFINLFCLETKCYSYKKIDSDYELTSMNKKYLFMLKDNFFMSINTGKETSENGEIGKFLFGKYNNLAKIKNCNIVATSGLSTIPFAITKINNNYLIDHCNIGLFTSLMHFQRSKKIKKVKHKENWALAIADPIIRSTQEIDNIKRTASLIRGVQDINDLPELPETLDEAFSIIGDKTKISTLLSRENANKLNIYNKNLSNYQIVSFSTHGLMAGETSFNYYPAILLSDSPAGNLLTASDILDLNGVPSIVLLAICNGSNNMNNLKNTEVSSIANAFLMKGSDAIISTYWALNSKASVEIIKNALQYYNGGADINKAFQKSAIQYKKHHPESQPKEWGAFLVIGNSKISDTVFTKKNEALGFAYDIAQLNNKIYTLHPRRVGVWDKKLKFMGTKKITSDVPKNKIKDLRFINQNDLSYLELTDEDLSYFKFNRDTNKFDACTQPLKTFRYKSFKNGVINSIAEDDDAIYITFSKNGESIFSIIKIHRNNMCQWDWINRNAYLFGNATRLNQPLLQIFKDEIYVVNNSRSKQEDKFNLSVVGFTNQGLEINCSHSPGQHITKIPKDFAKYVASEGSNTEIYYAGQLSSGNFSRTNVTQFLAHDKCSRMNKLLTVPKKTFMQALNDAEGSAPKMIYDNLGKYDSMKDLGKGPQAIDDLYEYNNLIISYERFFKKFNFNKLIQHSSAPLNKLTNGEINKIEGKDLDLYEGISRYILEDKTELTLQEEWFDALLNSTVVAQVKGGDKKFVSTRWSCLRPSGLTFENSIYVICNQPKGYSIRKFD